MMYRAAVYMTSLSDVIDIVISIVVNLNVIGIIYVFVINVVIDIVHNHIVFIAIISILIINIVYSSLSIASESST